MDVVVGQPSSKKFRGWSSPVWLGIAAVVVLAVVIAGMILWRQHTNRNKEVAKIDATIAQSEDAYQHAEYVNALNIVRTVLEKTKTKEQKVRAYQAAAQAANSANRLADAAGFYEQKHRIDASTEPADAYTLGIIYERLGKKTEALAQYKIALEYAKTHKTRYGTDADAIQASIDALGAGQ